MLGLAEAIEAKDAYTKGHCGRVAAYAMALAHECGYPEAELESLEFASFLHDIGKIGVRDSVLLKPGPLDEEEWMHMREHPVKGFDRQEPNACRS
jgi:putative two-component system response regulator